MKDPTAGSTLHNIFYTLGHALGEAEGRSTGEPWANRPEADSEPASAARSDAVDEPEAEPDPAGNGRDAGDAASAPVPAPGADAAGGVIPPDAAGAALAAAATGWLLARLFRPRSVRWHRAVLAGVAGTACIDVAGVIARRLGAVPSDAPAPGAPLHYAIGIATAVAYASVFYPRLPGRPITRGLLFGAIEAAAAPAGGSFTLLRRLTPGITYPLEALAPPGLQLRGPISALAFGFGLALYRDGTEDR